MTEILNDDPVEQERESLLSVEEDALQRALFDQQVKFPFTEADDAALVTELSVDIAEEMAAHTYRDPSSDTTKGLLFLSATVLAQPQARESYFQTRQRRNYVERVLDQEGLTYTREFESEEWHPPQPHAAYRRWVTFFEQEQRELLYALSEQEVSFPYDEQEAEITKQRLLANRDDFDADMDGSREYVDFVANNLEALKTYHYWTKLYELTGQLLANEGIGPQATIPATE